jgi:arsenite methyltransferase
MSRESACSVYEHLASTDLASQGIRPGGLELTERALAYCGFSQNSTILDAGCGTGITLDRLIRVHGFSAMGIDASSVLLHQSRNNNPAVPLVRASAESIPFPDGCADGVLAECSLSVMDDPASALDEFRRVLRIGGRLIVTDVYARNPGGVARLADIPMQCCLRGAISKEKLSDRLSNHGFKIDLWEDHSDLLTKFAVSLVFSYGSMNQFWLRSGSEGVDPEEIGRAISGAKPGYFLLVARKDADGQRTPKGDSP